MSTESSNKTQPIRFFHRGKTVDVSGVHPTRSVLDWLRELCGLPDEDWLRQALRTAEPRP